jgi:hypothetical protein
MLTVFGVSANYPTKIEYLTDNKTAFGEGVMHAEGGQSLLSKEEGHPKLYAARILLY